MDPVNQFVVDHVITPLQQAGNHLTAIDTIHHSCVQQFSQNVGQLFGQGAPFSGAGADTLSQAFNAYLATEAKLTAGGLSQRLKDITNSCTGTAAYIHKEMDWYYTPPWPDTPQGGMASMGAVFVGGATLDEVIAGIVTDLAAAIAGSTVLAVGGIVLLAVAVAVAEAYIDNKTKEAEMVLTALASLQQALVTEESIKEPSLPSNGPGSGGNGDNSGRTTAALALLILGAATAGGLYIANSNAPTAGTSDPPVDPQRSLSGLSQGEWDALKRYLNQKYGCTASEIQAIVNKLGKKNLTEYQLEIILQVLQVQAQMKGLLDQMAGNNTPGVKRLQDLLNNDMKGISNDMKYNSSRDGSTLYEWSARTLNTWREHLSSVGFEWEAVQTLGMKNITGFEVRHPGLDGQIDFETADGTWYESKNEGAINEQKLFEQLAKYARAGAPALGIVVPANAPQNIGWLLLQRLRDEGFTQYGSIKVIFEPPYNPLKPGGWCTVPDQNYLPPSR